MDTILKLRINGIDRTFEAGETATTLAWVIAQLQLKTDRVAVEHNGTIVPRDVWTSHPVRDGDRLEIVHFVGGGTR